MGTAGPTQSTLVFNSAGQAFSIPLHAAHLQHLSQATAVYGPDGTQYYQPVTQLTAPATGPKITRTDRLEVCIGDDSQVMFSVSFIPTLSVFFILFLKQW